MRKWRKYRKLLRVALLLLVITLELAWLNRLAKEAIVETVAIDEFTYDMSLFDCLMEELKCFPVVKEETNETYPVNYENSWGEKRSYGGERSHEGCDLMAESNERGKYKICSMTNGTVDKIGWLEQGGWRIGILSDSGIYYYYAHLDSYEKAFEEGERVVAGQILGRMGDSGYGKKPGTKGNFAVHLHVGIYVKDFQGKERPINPYWYLKQLEI